MAYACVAMLSTPRIKSARAESLTHGAATLRGLHPMEPRVKDRSRGSLNGITNNAMMCVLQYFVDSERS